MKDSITVAAQIILQMTFSMTRGNDKKFAFNPLTRYFPRHPDHKNNPNPNDIRKKLCVDCKPHLCYIAFLNLEFNIKNYVAVKTIVHVMLGGEEQYEFKVSSENPKDSVIWKVMKLLDFSEEYILELLEGVNFTVVVKEQFKLSLQVYDRWEHLDLLELEEIPDWFGISGTI